MKEFMQSQSYLGVMGVAKELLQDVLDSNNNRKKFENWNTIKHN